MTRSCGWVRWPLRSVDKSRGSPDSSSSSSSSSSLSAGARQVRPNGKEWRDVEAQSRPRPVWSGRSAGRDNARPSVSRSREEERARDGAEAEGRESERERERERISGKGGLFGQGRAREIVKSRTAERAGVGQRLLCSHSAICAAACLATLVGRRAADPLQLSPGQSGLCHAPSARLLLVNVTTVPGPYLCREVRSRLRALSFNSRAAVSSDGGLC